MTQNIARPTIWIALGLVALLAIAIYAATVFFKGSTTVAASTQGAESVTTASTNEQGVTILTEDDRPAGLKFATNSWNTN